MEVLILYGVIQFKILTLILLLNMILICDADSILTISPEYKRLVSTSGYINYDISLSKGTHYFNYNVEILNNLFVDSFNTTSCVLINNSSKQIVQSSVSYTQLSQLSNNTFVGSSYF